VRGCNGCRGNGRRQAAPEIRHEHDDEDRTDGGADSTSHRVPSGVKFNLAKVLPAARILPAGRHRLSGEQQTTYLHRPQRGRCGRQQSRAADDRNESMACLDSGDEAYRAAEHRLVAADVPFWFLKGKAPAVRFALRGTGLDLERLGMTPGELERYGAALILDENAASGDRLLIWTK